MRRLVLADHAGGMFTWNCSHCQWRAPVILFDGTATNAVEAVKKFGDHRCEDDPSKEIMTSKTSLLAKGGPA